MRQPKQFQPDQPKTPLGRKILNALKEQNEHWISRSQIAQAIGRPDGKIRANDIEYLKKLVAFKLIEVREVTIGAAQTKFEYRYIPQK